MVYLAFMSWSQSIMKWRKSGQKLKVGTWKQELKHRLWKSATYWLIPHGLLHLLTFYTAQDHLARVVPLTVTWAFSHQSLMKMPTDLSIGQCGDIFSIEIPSSQMPLDYVGLIKNIISNTSKSKSQEKKIKWSSFVLLCTNAFHLSGIAKWLRFISLIQIIWYMFL